MTNYTELYESTSKTMQTLQAEWAKMIEIRDTLCRSNDTLGFAQAHIACNQIFKAIEQLAEVQHEIAKGID